jgi:hypothetical protein
MVSLSIGLFFGSLWQFEIVQLRKERGEPYSLPFFITTDHKYSFWGDFWVALMVISYLLLLLSTIITEFRYNDIFQKFIEGL